MRLLLMWWWLTLPHMIISQVDYRDDVGLLPFYPHNDNSYHLADISDVQADTFVNYHSAIRRLSPESLKATMSALSAFSDTIVDQKKGWLKHFFTTPGRIYTYRSQQFKFGVNGLFDFNSGYDRSREDFIFLNKRGVELYGSIDDKLYFYTTFHETQADFLDYQKYTIDNYQSIRGQTHYKPYQSSLIDGVNGYDYAYIQGYLGYNLSRHSSLELGHDRHKIGNGYRSLLLGDEGTNYFYLKLDINVWKLHYQTIWAELSSVSSRYTPDNILLPKKYMVNHYLSIKPTKNLELGLFEAIIFSRENNFELQYLNPVIFLRVAELQLDSPDNVLLGVNAKWNLLEKIQLYGQLLLDELRVNEIFSAEKWWGNKYGLQFGIKGYNIMDISGLYMQLEYNRVRPYTYSHRISSSAHPEIALTSYSHYNQPLAHPLGANFSEYLALVGYKRERWQMQLRGLYTRVGRNRDENYGGDVLVPTTSRISEYGIEHLQGSLSKIKMLEFSMSYKLATNLYLDLLLMTRKESHEDLQDISNQYIGGGFRFNVARTSIDY